MTQVNFKINEEEQEKIEFLKKFVKTKKGKPTRTRTKVFKFCLNRTYEFYKNLMNGK